MARHENQVVVVHEPDWTADSLESLMTTEGFRVHRYEYQPGMYFAPHRHNEFKCDAVIQGCLRLEIDGVTYDLNPGDRIYLPPNTEHDARVIGDQSVVSLDGVRG